MKVDYDDLLTNYHEKIEIIEKQDIEIWELSKEIERLNNIINELEKYLNEQIQKSWEIEEQCYEDIESKLQELLGSDKE